jgi:hypothetical protein
MPADAPSICDQLSLSQARSHAWDRTVLYCTVQLAALLTQAHVFVVASLETRHYHKIAFHGSTRRAYSCNSD